MMIESRTRLESSRQLLLFVFRLFFLVGGCCRLCLAASVCGNPGCDIKTASHCPLKSDMSVAKICSTPSLPPPPPLPLLKFATQPSNMLYTSSPSTSMVSSMSIDCSIMDPALSSSSLHVNFSWEHNGAIIGDPQSQSNHDGIYVIHNGALSSRLTVSNGTEGLFRCRVTREGEGGRYTVVSRAATLSISTHSGWLDTVHISTATDTNQPLELKLPLGGSTVLECTPNITDPSRPSITWLRNDIPLNVSDRHHTLLPSSYSLILRDFSLPRALGGTDDVARYRCLLDGFEYYEAEIEREFRIRLAGERDEEFGSKFSVVPHDQSVVVGSNVTMYCIINSHTSSSTVVKWYKDDVILPEHLTNLIGEAHEVLFIQNVSLEDAGGYSCVAPSGENVTALLTVLAPPTHATISVSNYTITNGQLRLPSTTPTISMTITCNMDTDASPTTNGIEYEWFFRGDRVTVGGFSSKNLTYHAEGNELHLAGTVRGVTGSVQCFARNSDIVDSFLYSNSVSSSLQIVEVYTSNKPLPPTNIWYELFTPPWTYRLYFSPPSNLEGPFYSTNVSYHIEAFVEPTGTYSYYDQCLTCSVLKNFMSNNGSGMFDLNTVQLVSSGSPGKLYLRVAISVDNIMSEFASIPNCEQGIDLILNESPPAPVISSMSHDRKNGNVTLKWNNVKDCDYPRDGSSLQLFDTSVHMMCGDGLNKTLTTIDKDQYSVTHSVSGCVSCNWTVTYTVPNFSWLTSSTSHAINTDSALHAPTLLSPVTYDGHFIHFNATFVDSDLTCSSNLIVNSSSKSWKQFVFNDSCHINETLSSSSSAMTTTYSCAVAIVYPLEDCGRENHISVALKSDGPFSGVSTVHLPSKDDISALALALNVSATTSNSITVEYQLGDDMACLLQQSEVTARICCVEKSTDCECSLSSRCEPQLSNDCHEINEQLASSSVNMDGLKTNTTYCVMAQVSVASGVKWMDNSFVVETDKALPTTQPPLTTGSHRDDGSTTSSSSTSEGLTNTDIIGISVGGFVAAVLLVIITLVCICYCGRYKTNKKLEEQRAPLYNPTNNDINDEDPISIIGEGPPSVRSVGTNLEVLEHDSRLQSYLRDVQEYHSQSVDEEDYLVEDGGHQRKKDDEITEAEEHVVRAHSNLSGGVLAEALNSSLTGNNNRFDQFGSALNSATNSKSTTPTSVVSVTVEMHTLDEPQQHDEKEPLISQEKITRKDNNLIRTKEMNSLEGCTPQSKQFVPAAQSVSATCTSDQSSASTNSSGYLPNTDSSDCVVQMEPPLLAAHAAVTDNTVILEPTLPSHIAPGYVQGPNQEMTHVSNPISLRPASSGVVDSHLTQLSSSKQEVSYRASFSQPSLSIPPPDFSQEPTNVPFSSSTSGGESQLNSNGYVCTEEPDTFNAPSSSSSASYLQPSLSEPPEASSLHQHSTNRIPQSDTSSNGAPNYVLSEDSENGTHHKDTISTGQQNLSSRRLDGDLNLGFVQEFDDDNSSDSGSQNNSVFADDPPEGSQFRPPTNPARSPFSRTRSAVTSGIGSTSSDSPEPPPHSSGDFGSGVSGSSDYISSDPQSSFDVDEAKFTFPSHFDSRPISGTGDTPLVDQFDSSGFGWVGNLESSPDSVYMKSEQFPSQLTRRQSEGYQSGLPTPVHGSGGAVFDFQESFTKQHPLSLPLGLSSQGGTSNTCPLTPDPLQTPLNHGGDGSSSGYVSESVTSNPFQSHSGDGSSSGYMSESITSRPSNMSDILESTPQASEEDNHTLLLDTSFDPQNTEIVPPLSGYEEDNQSSHQINFEFPLSTHRSVSLGLKPPHGQGTSQLLQASCDGYANTAGIDFQKIDFQFQNQSSCSAVS